MRARLAVGTHVQSKLVKSTHETWPTFSKFCIAACNALSTTKPITKKKDCKVGRVTMIPPPRVDNTFQEPGIPLLYTHYLS